MSTIKESRAGSKGAQVEVRNLHKAYGVAVAVEDVTLTVQQGEFLALLGPSGSGKSTILMSMAGFETPTRGQILIDGSDCTHIPTFRRNIGMVFQNYTLFPHMTVLDNVAFPLKMRGVGRTERRARAQEALDKVQLGKFGARKPNELSGGQQQRVALARAIVYKPRLLLMDEPFSALDKKLREEMRLETKRLHADLGITIVFVTHDQEEALTMADRVAVLSHGRIQQIGPARDLYERPANLFAADFIGSMNFIPVTVSRNSSRLPDGSEWPLAPAAFLDAPFQGTGLLAIRPERITLSGSETDLKFTVQLRDIVYSGADTLVIASLPDGTEIQARCNSSNAATQNLTAGDNITLFCPKDAPLIYRSDRA